MSSYAQTLVSSVELCYAEVLQTCIHVSMLSTLIVQCMCVFESYRHAHKQTRYAICMRGRFMDIQVFILLTIVAKELKVLETREPLIIVDLLCNPTSKNKIKSRWKTSSYNGTRRIL
jgi:hypothetical protein